MALETAQAAHDLGGLRGPGAGPGAERLDLSEKLFFRHGLQEKLCRRVVEARSEKLLIQEDARDKEDRQIRELRILLQSPVDIQPGDVVQFQIQDHDIRPGKSDPQQR